MKSYSHLNLISGGDYVPTPLSQLSPSEFAVACAERSRDQGFFILGIVAIRSIVGAENFPIGTALATGVAAFYAIGAGLGYYFSLSQPDESYTKVKA